MTWDWNESHPPVTTPPSCFPTHATPPHPTPSQSLLAEWRSELARQPLSLSEADACAVLGLSTAARPEGGGVGEEELRRAYRGLARWGGGACGGGGGRGRCMGVRVCGDGGGGGCVGAGAEPSRRRYCLTRKRHSPRFHCTCQYAHARTHPSPYPRRKFHPDKNPEGRPMFLKARALVGAGGLCVCVCV